MEAKNDTDVLIANVQSQPDSPIILRDSKMTQQKLCQMNDRELAEVLKMSFQSNGEAIPHGMNNLKVGISPRFRG